MNTFDVELQGVALQFHPTGAVYWPAMNMLLLADLHLGKESVFQQAGIAIPSGATQSTLASLQGLVEEYRPRELIVLGDLLHARVGLTPWLATEIASMISNHREMRWILVPGNHDRGGCQRLRDCGWQVTEERIVRSAVELQHAPDMVTHGGQLQMSGHLHPSIRVSFSAREKEVVRCFWFSENRLVLPAFGGWTGTKPIAPSRADRVFLCVENDVIEFASGKY
jgi:DNA ligase-associated metallophosphoesterase